MLTGAVATVGLAGALGPASAGGRHAVATELDQEVAALEARWQRTIGLHAIDTVTGRSLRHRPATRFPVLSVVKTLLAAMVLRDHHGDLDRRLRWSGTDVVENSPVTEVTVRNGLTVAQLCEAAVTRSDNTAANVLLHAYGGPAAVTAFARRTGDAVTRLDRFEPELNASSPGDDRDTTTAEAVAGTYRRLELGRVLPPPRRDLLVRWLLASQTTTTRFGAGVPAGWALADKTGGGAYGTRNDVGVVWTPNGRALVLAVLTRSDSPDSSGRDEVLSAAARLCCDRLTARG